MELNLEKLPTEQDLIPIAVCSTCNKQWVMPEEWNLRCRVARHWKIQGKVFIHVCPDCEKKKKAEKA